MRQSITGARGQRRPKCSRCGKRRKDRIVAALEEFEKKCAALSELAKTCMYRRPPEFFSLPPMHPYCTHHKNRFKVCGHPDDCPILREKEAEGGGG